MKNYHTPGLRKCAVTAAVAVAMLFASMSPADASEPPVQVDRIAHVQLIEKSAERSGGTLVPSGTHVYLPAVVTR